MMPRFVHTGIPTATARWRRRLRQGPWPAASVIALAVSLNVHVFAQSRPASAPADISVEETEFPSFLSQPHDSQNDMELFNLDVPEVDVVQTATRSPKRIMDLPYAVSVVTAEDIRRSGARSVPDALRLLPGVDVADLSWGYSGVSTRGGHGLTADQVLVLMDGRQMFDPILGATFWYFWPIQLEDIERIEVLRGPAGVTWGANALNGVINIVTKDPADQVGLTTAITAGTRGAHKEHLGYGYADEKLKLRVSGEYEGSDGFRKGGSILQQLDDDFMEGRTGVHVVYDATPKDILTLSAGNSVAGGGNTTSPSFFPPDKLNPRSQTSFLLGKWDHRVARDNQFGLNAYVNDYHFEPGAKTIDYRYQQIALEFNHNFKLGDDHTLTWGLDSRTDLIDGTNSDPHLMTKDYVSSATIGLYVQDEWRFAPRWALELGARIDYEFYGGFQPSGRIALSHKFSDGSLAYGAVSRAFQMPPVGGRFADFALYSGLIHQTADPATDPQTVIAYELGYRKKLLSDRLTTNINLFWHDLDDVITATTMEFGPPGLIQSKYDNRASAAMYGFEFEAKYAATKQLTLLANYTYQWMDWFGHMPYTDKDFITPPEHKFMIGTQYDPIKDLHLSAYLYYVDTVKAPNGTMALLPMQIPPYFRLDLRAEYEFWKKQAAVAVGVRNLLDRDHPEGGTTFLNNAEVPRMIYAEFRMSLR